MKKNKMMRLASVLLVAVLMSTCAISGTFAKYVTTASGSNSARVAKFGVTVTAGGDAFKNQYPTNTENGFGYNEEFSVEGKEGAIVVAPGTSGTVDLFSVSGTPEVAVNVKAELTAISRIKLPAKTGYADKTGAGETFNVVADYYPIKWTLKKDGAAVTDAENVGLDAIVTALGTISKKYAPNKNLGTELGSYTLEWKWDYGTEADISDTDKMDTYLGDVIAGTVTDTTVVTTESFNFSITVTQID